MTFLSEWTTIVSWSMMSHFCSLTTFFFVQLWPQKHISTYHSINQYEDIVTHHWRLCIRVEVAPFVRNPPDKPIVAILQNRRRPSMIKGKSSKIAMPTLKKSWTSLVNFSRWWKFREGSFFFSETTNITVKHTPIIEPKTRRPPSSMLLLLLTRLCTKDRSEIRSIDNLKSIRYAWIGV